MRLEIFNNCKNDNKWMTISNPTNRNMTVMLVPARRVNAHLRLVGPYLVLLGVRLWLDCHVQCVPMPVPVANISNISSCYRIGIHFNIKLYYMILQQFITSFFPGCTNLKFIYIINNKKFKNKSIWSLYFHYIPF